MALMANTDYDKHSISIGEPINKSKINLKQTNTLAQQLTFESFSTFAIEWTPNLYEITQIGELIIIKTS
jgi:hypothetical protein